MQTTGGITFTSGIQFTPWVAPGLQGTYSFRISNPNAQSTPANDFFGGGPPGAGGSFATISKSLAISDQYALVGALGEKSSSNQSNVGKAYLFNMSNGSLKYTFTKPSATVIDDMFGFSTAVTDTYAIVGAPGIDVDVSNVRAGTGIVYCYSTTSGNLLYSIPWSYGSGQNFYNPGLGSSVDATNTYLIVGAPGKNTNVNNGGGAYVYHTSNGALKYTILNPQTNSGNEVGKSVALTDSQFIVGSGATYAYIYSMATGNLQYTLNDSGSYYGRSVDISDSYAIVGAPGWPTAGNSSGAAYIYSTSTGTKLYTLKAPQTVAGESFGTSVSITEKYAVVGTSAANGNVYMYSTTTGNLVAIYRNNNDATAGNVDYFGSYVAVTTNNMAISAPGDNNNSGTVYIYV